LFEFFSEQREERRVIVQASLNGARDASFHPNVPLNVEQIVESAIAAVRAGANELHVHVRDERGNESLKPEAVDSMVGALRNALPGTLIGISTCGWIENNDVRRLEYIGAWRNTPDHASVNIDEVGAIDVGFALHRRGISIEAGLSSLDDAVKFTESALAPLILRVLVEPDLQDSDRAMALATEIIARLSTSQNRKPILLHGFDETVWSFILEACWNRWSTRVGFEDTKFLPDGTEARSNAELIEAACGLKRQFD